MKKALIAIIGFLLVMAFHSTPTHAATFFVTDFNDSGPGTLRDAVNQANGNVGADYVSIPSGSTVITIILTSGVISITDDLTLAVSSGINLTVDGNANDVVFSIAPLTTVLIFNINIANGLGTTQGGGISNQGTLTLRNSTIDSNSANDGGGIWSSGTLTVENCTINGNSTNTSGGQGGGVFVSGNPSSFLDCTFFGNLATNGNGEGGGLYYATDVTVEGCTFTTNSAGEGGAISALSTGLTLTLTNSTISGNIETGSGGAGIYLQTANTIDILNCTFTSNSDNAILLLSGTVTSQNSIYSGHPGGDLAGAFTSNGNNIIGDDSGSSGFVDGVLNDQVGTTASPIDPLLGQLANNGGPTQTQALLPGSPAINTGNAVGAPTVDQREYQRGVLVDIGAFEFIPLPRGSDTCGLLPENSHPLARILPWLILFLVIGLLRRKGVSLRN